MSTSKKKIKAAAFSRGIVRIPGLDILLGVDEVLYAPSGRQARGVDLVVGWGRKANTRKAVEYAARYSLPYVTLEDGFLRSVDPGVSGGRPLSIVLDPTGIYYDAGAPSGLEQLLNSGRLPEAYSSLPGSGQGPVPTLKSGKLLARARAAMDGILSAGLSKYNHGVSVELPKPSRSGAERVLVVDQTFGDMSVSLGLAGRESFLEMLGAALEENPEADIWVKTHPDVLAGKKKGYLDSTDIERIVSSFAESHGKSQGGQRRVNLLAENANPLHLISQVDRVYTVSSQMGFEALLAGRPVSCFGVPFYAGWGLTDDRVPLPRRKAKRSLEEIFAAAYILYPRYLDPCQGTRGEIEPVIGHLAEHRRIFQANRGEIYCFGTRLWKRNHIKAFLRSPGNRLKFKGSVQQARKEIGSGNNARLTALVTWGAKQLEPLRELSGETGVPLWRIEDGFLRSVGLGSDFTKPFSLVVDKKGIYYDPGQPSDLEDILCHAEFTADELGRAARLREMIVEFNISKYNFVVNGALRVARNKGQQVVLVPGQVEDDASIKAGCRDVSTNLGLLREVRKARQNGYIIYKEHPDVTGGNRKGRVSRNILLEFCDEVAENVSIGECLQVSDEVHTMTSLVGFEALLRSKRVFTYGIPFYAGWGLTEDRHILSRRNRVLTLDQLVAGSLIRYPRYLDWQTGEFSTPECAIHRLYSELGQDSGNRNIRKNPIKRKLNKLANLIGKR
ncbi:MAG: capsular polysaccharide biosynthesis protein [Deltaproteobacteria bacterium]|nr:capsular polysaccharide biosynthesis protein [Deltaproteobacteria bacterium]